MTIAQSSPTRPCRAASTRADAPLEVAEVDGEHAARVEAPPRSRRAPGRSLGRVGQVVQGGARRRRRVGRRDRVVGQVSRSISGASGAVSRASSSIAGDASVAITRWPGVDQVAGEQAAATAELDDEAMGQPDRFEQLQDPGCAGRRVEREPRVVDEREVAPVVRLRKAHARANASARATAASGSGASTTSSSDQVSIPTTGIAGAQRERDLRERPVRPPTATTASAARTTSGLRISPIPVAIATVTCGFAAPRSEPRQQPDHRPARPGRAARRRLHDPSESSTHDHRTRFAEQPPDGLGARRFLGRGVPGPDHRHVLRVHLRDATP